MSPEQITQWAKEAGIPLTYPPLFDGTSLPDLSGIMRFANLVVAHEREQRALVCDDIDLLKRCAKTLDANLYVHDTAFGDAHEFQPKDGSKAYIFHPLWVDSHAIGLYEKLIQKTRVIGSPQFANIRRAIVLAAANMDLTLISE